MFGSKKPSDVSSRRAAEKQARDAAHAAKLRVQAAQQAAKNKRR